MPRRLIVCCDATWKTADQAIAGHPSPAKVTKLAVPAKFDATLPNDPDSARSQIAAEYATVRERSDEHTWRAANWDTLASWLRMIVTLTAGISALSVFADNNMVAAIFASITALVAAVNAGFNPPEKAKLHRDAARGYGRSVRPLHELLHALDTPRTAGKRAHEGHVSTTDGIIRAEKLPAAWEDFLLHQEQIERIEESALRSGLGNTTHAVPERAQVRDTGLATY